MSTDIIYDKQFVKLPNKTYIPFVLGGSSNCYQYDRSSRGRRSRSWGVMSYMTTTNKTVTEAELMAKIELEKQRQLNHAAKDSDNPDVLNDFSYYTSLVFNGMHSRSTFNSYKSFFITGMKKALTVKQLLAERVEVRIYTYDYNGKYQKQAAEQGIEWLEPVNATSTEHLIELIQKFYNHYKGTDFSWYMDFDSVWSLENQMKAIRSKYFPTKKNERKEYETIKVDHYYTVTFTFNGNTHYYVKSTRRGTRYTHYPYHNFQTEKEAKKFAQSRKRTILLTVERIDEPATIRVVKTS